MTSKGLRLNGKAYALRGKILEQDLTEAAAKDLRNADVNTLLANVSTDDASLWDLADRFGFFVLAMSQDIAHFQSLRNELTRHPSHFGWIFNRNDFFAGPNSETDRGMLYGVNTSAQGELPGADFLFCHERELAWLNEMNLPKIVVTPSVASAVPRSDVIGWIESAA
jgi:hypothetical protein